MSASTSTYFFLPMVRLHTMLTRAAPMPPMIAAALPPPGVAALEASASRNDSTAVSLISVITSSLLPARRSPPRQRRRRNSRTSCRCTRDGVCCLLYTSDAADDLLCVDLG